MKTGSILMLTAFMMLNNLAAESLFQVKDQNDKTVLDVTSAGLVILNPNGNGYDDTLMVITSTQMKTFVAGGTGKGLARSFEVVSSSSNKSGQSSLFNLTPGNYFIGHNSGSSITSGTRNLFFGYQSGVDNYAGSRNIFIGDSSGFGNKWAADNIFIGSSSGYSNNANGYNNLFMGIRSGYHNYDGDENLFLGNLAGFSNTIGSNNVYMGYNSGMKAVSANNNVFIGKSTGENYTAGYGNVLIGQETGQNFLSGSRNTMLGYSAGYQLNNSSELTDNVFIGAVAGRKMNGSRNTIIGSMAGEVYQSGSTGYGNVFIGYSAGRNETASNLLYIANNENTPLIYGQFGNGRVAINTTDPHGYNFFVNGTSGGTSGWTQYSDERKKTNIHTVKNALDKIKQLRGVNYNWKEQPTGKDELGFIAQEVEAVLPEVVNKSGDTYMMQYAPINAVLVEAMKELDDTNKQLEARNTRLEQEIAEIKAMLIKLNK